MGRRRHVAQPGSDEAAFGDEIVAEAERLTDTDEPSIFRQAIRVTFISHVDR